MLALDVFIQTEDIIQRFYPHQISAGFNTTEIELEALVIVIGFRVQIMVKSYQDGMNERDNKNDPFIGINIMPNNLAPPKLNSIGQLHPEHRFKQTLDKFITKS